MGSENKEPSLNEQLIDAAINGRLADVKRLLVAGANVHADDDRALREAALIGYNALVVTLLNAGADVHACNDMPLCHAAFYGNNALVVTLLNAGADVHVCCESVRGQESVLGRVAARGSDDVVETLLTAGANVHTRNDEALRLAIFHGHNDVVVTLLRLGANIHAVNNGRLNQAAERGHHEVIITLVGAGADIHNLPVTKATELARFRDIARHLVANAGTNAALGAFFADYNRHNALTVPHYNGPSLEKVTDATLKHHARLATYALEACRSLYAIGARHDTYDPDLIPPIMYTRADTP